MWNMLIKPISDVVNNIVDNVARLEDALNRLRLRNTKFINYLRTGK